MEWPFFYNYFIKLSIYNTIHLLNVHVYYIGYRSLYGHMVCNVPVSRKTNRDRNRFRGVSIQWPKSRLIVAPKPINMDLKHSVIKRLRF